MNTPKETAGYNCLMFATLSVQPGSAYAHLNGQRFPVAQVLGGGPFISRKLALVIYDNGNVADFSVTEVLGFSNKLVETAEELEKDRVLKTAFIANSEEIASAAYLEAAGPLLVLKPAGIYIDVYLADNVAARKNAAPGPRPEAGKQIGSISSTFAFGCKDYSQVTSATAYSPAARKSYPTRLEALAFLARWATARYTAPKVKPTLAEAAEGFRKVLSEIPADMREVLALPGAAILDATRTIVEQAARYQDEQATAAKMEPGYNSRGELTEVSIVAPDPAEPTIATEDPEPVDNGQPLTVNIQTADGFNLNLPATNPELRRNILAAQARNAAGKGASLAILGLPGQHSNQPETLSLRGLPAHLNSAMPEAIQSVMTQRQIAEATKGIAKAQAKINSRRLQVAANKMQARPEVKRALELMETELGRMKEALIELTELGVQHDVEYLGSLARAGAPFPEDWNMYIQRLREAAVLDTNGNWLDAEYKALYMSKIA